MEKASGNMDKWGGYRVIADRFSYDSVYFVLYDIFYIQVLCGKICKNGKCYYGNCGTAGGGGEKAIWWKILELIW